MIETTKRAFYAAVGAPMVTARRAGEMFKEISDKVTERFGDVSDKLTEDARKEFDLWVTEGEKLVGKLSEQKVVEDLSARVDLEEIQERVGKLRDQLEDVLASWRASFAPESAKVEKPVIETEEKPAPKAPTARKPAAKKPAAKKPATKTATAKKATASKTTTTRKPAAKKPAATTK
jgi:cell division septation protein DedD